MDKLRRSLPNLLTGVVLVAVLMVSAARLLNGRSLAAPVRRDSLPEVPDPQKLKPLPPTSVHVQQSDSTKKTLGQYKQSWPDLLIGAALIYVIAMIVATLLSGTSLVSLVRRGGPAEAPVATTTDTAEVTSNLTGTAATPVADKTGTGAAQTPDGYPDSYDMFVPNVPDQSAASAEGGVSTDSGSVAETAEQPSSAAPAASGFRVAAGALLSMDSASTVAQNYRADGYEVVVEKQDAFYLLWIGPYTAQADANVAAQHISANGGDALVYPYGDNDSAADASDTVEATRPEDAAPDGAVAQPRAPDAKDRNADGSNEVAATTAPVGGGTIAMRAGDAASEGRGRRYLQVGAFAVDGSDRPLRAQLNALGLSITSDEDASGLVRLYVGPFDSAQLTQTRARLTTQGIDSFPITP